MNKTGPIVIIEDDEDDQSILKEIFVELNCLNEIVFFNSGVDALEYLNDLLISPFIIISDIHLPRLTGIELRDMLHNNEQIRLKCIPYLIFTTGATHQATVDVYSKSIQGFFIKPASYNELSTLIKKIIDYWTSCTAPNLN